MFDPSAPHIIILLVVVLLLFGSRRLPGAARSLGQSMHIFKRSVQGMEPEDQNSAANPSGQVVNNALPPVFLPPGAGPAQDPTQQQLQDLQRQVTEMQRQSASSGNGQPAETQTPQPR